MTNIFGLFFFCGAFIVLCFVFSDSWFAKLEKHDEMLISVNLLKWGEEIGVVIGREDDKLIIAKF